MINLSALPNQRPDEKMIRLLRRHWIVPMKLIGFFLLAAALPIGAFLLMQNERPAILSDPLLAPALAVAVSFYYLAIWMFTFQEIVDYYLDMWIVTTERVINIEQFGLFTRKSSELHLENIVDITSEVRGMVHTLLNYGDVLVQSSAEKLQFNFKEVPRPDDVREMILKAIDEDRSRHQRATTSSVSLSQSNEPQAH